jgi:hypothetical protein
MADVGENSESKNARPDHNCNREFKKCLPLRSLEKFKRAINDKNERDKAENYLIDRDIHLG